MATKVSYEDIEVRKNYAVIARLGLAALLANLIIEGSYVYISLMATKLAESE